MGRAESGIWKYAERLPAVQAKYRESMGEGQTPLVKSKWLGAELGIAELYFKLESLNPTGSYKDRISALGVSLAKEHGKKACIGTTSGNAGASIAAYAARAGLDYHVYVQENIVASKLEQILLHRANVYKVRGMGFRAEIGSRVFELVQVKSRAENWELLVTAYAYAPQAMEAVKTIAYEVYDELGSVDGIFAPVGGGGLLAGVHRGFDDLRRLGCMDRLPKMFACQSSGCANLVKGWEQGLSGAVPGDSTSRISGIQVPNPPDGRLVFHALHESAGSGLQVEDVRTWHWQEQLAWKEGIFCEPAGAIGLAGLAQAARDGKIRPSDRVICIVSGAGYKDAERAQAMAQPFGDLPLLHVDDLE
jgi:threonine synthase